MSSQFAVPSSPWSDASPLLWEIDAPERLNSPRAIPGRPEAAPAPNPELTENRELGTENRELKTGSWRPATGDRQLASIVPASRLGDRPRPAMAASGVPAVDALTGGMPRGGLTEICGAASSGRTSLLLSAMAQATARGEVVALVDAGDCFDPASAQAAGVELKKILWVRCAQPCQMADADGRGKSRKQALFGPRQATWKYSALDQALKATDLLLQAGGFGMVVVDFGDVPEQVARRVPLTSWFRFRRSVEHTDTVLLALTRESCAKSCASLVLRLTAGEEAPARKQPLFTGPKPGASTLDIADRIAIGTRQSEMRNPVTHAQLLHGLEIRAEVLRDAVQGKKPVQSAARFHSATEWKRTIG